MSTPNQALISGVGPLPASHPAPTGTAPLTGTGVLNLSQGTSVVKVLSASPKGIKGPSRKVKILVITASRYLAWAKQTPGTAPVITADAVATSTNGSLVSSSEWILIPANLELYIVASAAATICQIHVEEV